MVVSTQGLGDGSFDVNSLDLTPWVLIGLGAWAAIKLFNSGTRTTKYSKRKITKARFVGALKAKPERSKVLSPKRTNEIFGDLF